VPIFPTVIMQNEFSTNNPRTESRTKEAGKKNLSGDEEWEDREHQKQA
jgi:hypothetical protein